MSVMIGLLSGATANAMPSTFWICRESLNDAGARVTVKMSHYAGDDYRIAVYTQPAPQAPVSRAVFSAVANPIDLSTNADADWTNSDGVSIFVQTVPYNERAVTIAKLSILATRANEARIRDLRVGMGETVDAIASTVASSLMFDHLICESPSAKSP